MKFGNATKFRPHDDKINSTFIPEDLDLLFALDIDMDKPLKANTQEFGDFSETGRRSTLNTEGGI